MVVAYTIACISPLTACLAVEKIEKLTEKEKMRTVCILKEVAIVRISLLFCRKYTLLVAEMLLSAVFLLM